MDHENEDVVVFFLFQVFVGDFPAIHHVSSHQLHAEAYLGSIKQRRLVQALGG